MDTDPREAARRIADEVIAENPGATLEEINRLLAERRDAYNATPQQELAGLSPLQMRRLLYADWTGENAPFTVRPDIPLSELDGSRIVHNTRLLLDAMRGPDGTRATAKGNLNRALVRAVAHQMRLNRNEHWLVYTYYKSKVLNEADLQELETLRYVLSFAGLIRKARGRFYVTPKGEKLLAPELAGELLALLFHTVFRTLSLGAWLSGLPDTPELQNTIAFSFYVLSRLNNEWHDVPEGAPALVLPAVRDRLPTRAYGDSVEFIAEGRILRPLELLGLVELKEREWGARDAGPDRLRKTPLFDRAIAFRL